MGMCYETRADRTRYIINEDFRIKQEMIRTFQNYARTQQDQISQIYEEKHIEFLQKTNYPIQVKPLNNNEKIIIRKNINNLSEVYKLERQLGEGGYGQVFLVRHRE